jgi:type IV secretory pathway VirB4 component
MKEQLLKLTIQELIDMLNEKVKDITYKGERAELHKKVDEATSEVMEQYGLRRNTWFITIVYDARAYLLLQYSSAFDVDQRTKKSIIPSGKIRDVRFSMVTKRNGIEVTNNPAMTVQEFLVHYRIAISNESIQRCKEMITEYTTILQQTQKDLTGFEEEVSRLEKELHELQLSEKEIS